MISDQEADGGADIPDNMILEGDKVASTTVFNPETDLGLNPKHLYQRSGNVCNSAVSCTPIFVSSF